MKKIRKYPIVFQAPSDEIYDEAVGYINKVARWDEFRREMNRVNYYLEGYREKKIRTTPSKRTIELTSTIDEEIIESIKHILKIK